MKRKILSLIVLIALSLSLVACGAIRGGKTPFGKREYISKEQYRELFKNPQKFKGKYVKMSGQIFFGPDPGKKSVTFQLVHDVDHSMQDFILQYTGEESFAIDDFVEADALIVGQFGKNSPTLVLRSDSVKKVSYTDIAAPTVKETTPENAVTEQNGVTLKIDKIEFAKEETRIFFTETNNTSDKISLNGYGMKLIQDGVQYEPSLISSSIYRGGYTELPLELLPGANASGVVVFAPLGSFTDFQLHAQCLSQDFNTHFDPLVVDVAVP